MHEMSLVSGVLDAVLPVARDAGAARVCQVNLRIGDMVEVVPDALDFAWECLRDEDPLTAECELSFTEVHPRSRCLACGEEFDHSRFHVRCPRCGGAETRLLQGREFDIVSIEVETPDDEPGAPDATHDGVDPAIPAAAPPASHDTGR